MKKTLLMILVLSTILMCGCEHKKYRSGDKVRVPLENVEGVVIETAYNSNSKVVLTIKFRANKPIKYDPENNPRSYTHIGDNIYTMRVLQSEVEEIDEFSKVLPATKPETTNVSKSDSRQLRDLNSRLQKVLQELVESQKREKAIKEEASKLQQAIDLMEKGHIREIQDALAGPKLIQVEGKIASKPDMSSLNAQYITTVTHPNGIITIISNDSTLYDKFKEADEAKLIIDVEKK